MKKSLFLGMIMVCAALALNSCKKDYLVDVVGRVTGNVKTYDNSYLAKVLVTVEGTSIKDSTDENGFYELNGLPAGASTLIFTKDGYTKSRTSVSIVAPTAVANTTSGSKQSYVYSVLSSTVLYPMTGTAKGYVYYNGAPVANAKVYAYPSITSYIDQPYYSTTTAADGSYSFSTLPIITVASVYYSFVSYHPSISDASGSVTTSDITSRTTEATINLSIDPLVFVGHGLPTISGYYTADTASNTSITLTFSDNVSKTITESKGGSVYIYCSSTGTYLSASLTYTGNTVVVTPSVALTHGYTYYMYYNVYSTSIKYVSSNFNFKAAARVNTLSGQPVINTTDNVGYLTLKTATYGATGYDIYYLTPSMTDYLLLQQNYSFSSTYSISSYATGTKFYVIPREYSEGSYYFGTASAVVTK